MIFYSSNPIPALPSVQTPEGRMAVLGYDPVTIRRVVELMLERAGLTQAEAARRMGITAQTLNQYCRGRRQHTSVQWMSRLAEVCGGKILVEFPRDKQEA